MAQTLTVNGMSRNPRGQVLYEQVELCLRRLFAGSTSRGWWDPRTGWRTRSRSLLGLLVISRE